MTAVFVGATLPVIGMGVAPELGKLSAVACLGRRYGSAPLRAALVALVAVLIGLNAIGAYGFLAKAHIGYAGAGETAVAGRAAGVDARITVQAGVVADINWRIAQIDGAVEKATAKGQTSAALPWPTSNERPGPSWLANALPRPRRLPACRCRRRASMASVASSKPTAIPGHAQRRRQRNSIAVIRADRRRAARPGPQSCCCWRPRRRGGSSTTAHPAKRHPSPKRGGFFIERLPD
jgi:hypothetical protein